jgi:hypothetical protein
VAGHVAGTVGAHPHDPNAAVGYGARHGVAELARTRDLDRRDPVQRRDRGDVDALRRAEQRLEVLRCGLGLREEREDPAAVVVDLG